MTSNESTRGKEQEPVTIYDFSRRKINQPKTAKMVPTNVEFDAVTVTVESDNLHAMEDLGRETDKAYKWLKPRSHPAL